MTFKLEAINRCLRAIGETPVNAITSSLPEAADARSLVDEVTKEVLAAGWHCNTNYNVKLTPDIDGYIRVPNTYISVDTSGVSRHINVAVREDPNDELLKLFNIKDQTFVFTDPLYTTIVLDFDIDSLPYQLQNYIAWKAARQFQQGSVGAIGLDRFVAFNLETAWNALLDWEEEADDTNILTGSYYMLETTGRNNSLSGR